MRKGYLFLAFGVLAGLAAFAVCFLIGTASTREVMTQPDPEMAWLKKEFDLGDAEYQRIVKLHQAYLPQCAMRCAQIEEQNEELKRLLAESPGMTDEIQAVMAKRAQMRADCEAEMLRHFLEVSRSMPLEQGKRYLAWVEQQTLFRGEAMEQLHKAGSPVSEHHHH
jgi:hypothetical protein